MNIALILLAGSGTRLGGYTPKQFLLKKNIPLYMYSVNKFINNGNIDHIVLVVSNEYYDHVKEEVDKLTYKNINLVSGGNARFQSVYNGLRLIKYMFPNKLNEINVLIHDSVRCNVTNHIINKNISLLEKYPAVLTAIKGDKQEERVDTSHIYNGVNYLAQTPQSFRFNYIFNLYEEYVCTRDRDIFDDVSLVKNELDIGIVLGETFNYKITTKEDYDRFVNENYSDYDIYLFDFDGTIVDSHYSLYLMYKYAFAKVGMTVTVDEAKVYMKETIFKTFARRSDDKEKEKIFVDAINEYVHSKEVTEANRLYPEVKEVVEELHTRGKILGLISSNNADHMKDVLSYLGIDTSIFSVYVGCLDIKNFKPDPEGIFLALKKLNYESSKQRACYIGDSKGDVLATINAGIDSFFVVRDHNSEDEILPNSHKMTSLKELLK